MLARSLSARHSHVMKQMAEGEGSICRAESLFDCHHCELHWLWRNLITTFTGICHSTVFISRADHSSRDILVNFIYPRQTIPDQDLPPSQKFVSMRSQRFPSLFGAPANGQLETPATY
jgi:hypothetical protein